MIRDKQPIVYEQKQVLQALMALCSILDAQRDRFTNGQDDATDRDVAVQSVAAVMDFLKAALPQAPELCDVFMWLLASLDDRPGKVRDLRNETRWATAAAVITLYHEDHRVSVAVTAGEIETIFNARRIPLPGGINSRNNLLTYRKEITRKTGQQSVGLELYRAALKNARAQAQPGESAAKLLRDVLVDTMLDTPHAGAASKVGIIPTNPPRSD